MARQVLLVLNPGLHSHQLKDALVQNGYLVWLVSDLKHAIAGAEAVRPNVVIVEWNQTGIDGLSIVQELRSRFKSLQVAPTIICTDRQLDPTEVQQLWLQNIRHVCKSPVSIDEVANAIRRSLSTSAILRLAKPKDSTLV